MATAWLTYDWDDNAKGDVDFMAAELTKRGLTVHLDRRKLRAGLPLWDQIKAHISDPTQSDAWIIYATQDSLTSEACLKELVWAFDRAMKQRGTAFPIILLLPATVDHSLVPPTVVARLYVSRKDADWAERVVASAEGRDPNIAIPSPEPFHLEIHTFNAAAGSRYAIEVRPRAGTWCPFVAAVPIDEKERVNYRIGFGPAGTPMADALWGVVEGTGTEANVIWASTIVRMMEATPTMSFYVFVSAFPTRLLFGSEKGPRYIASDLERRLP